MPNAVPGKRCSGVRPCSNLDDTGPFPVGQACRMVNTKDKYLAPTQFDFLMIFLIRKASWLSTHRTVSPEGHHI
jgi:hypothetical protein